MKSTSGASFFDDFLAGGYENNVVTTIYGPSGSGKTNLCLLAAVRVAQAGKKVLFIDTEGGICTERIQQLCQDPVILERIIFMTPYTFAEQKIAFEQLKEMITSAIGMIVIDSIAMLYRLELGRSEGVYEVNAELGKQVALLVEIARRHSVPVLITNQVYSDFGNRDQVKMVGGDLLKYGSKCLIELQRQDDTRKAILRKHRALPEGKEVSFRITQQGFEEY